MDRIISETSVVAAIKRPTCRYGFGAIGFGLSVFAWPWFPSIASGVLFASTFSLGVAVTCAWIGARVDRSVADHGGDAVLPKELGQITHTLSRIRQRGPANLELGLDRDERS